MSASSSVPPSTTARHTGAHHLAISLGLAGLAWLVMTLQEILLFARPTPYGGPYAERWSHYFPYAIAYNVLAVMLISALPALGWLLWYIRQVGAGIARIVHGVQLGLLMVAVSLDHADNEVMRFMGVHLSLGLLHAYHRVNAWGNDMLYIFLYDQGGPGLPFLIIVASPFVLWLVSRQLVHRAPLAFPALALADSPHGDPVSAACPNGGLQVLPGEAFHMAADPPGAVDPLCRAKRQLLSGRPSRAVWEFGARVPGALVPEQRRHSMAVSRPPAAPGAGTADRSYASPGEAMECLVYPAGDFPRMEHWISPTRHGGLPNSLPGSPCPGEWSRRSGAGI